ncbi:MAG: hypothetical protein U0P30_05870 [Vicinamibacterales bacterium]
MTRDQEEVRRQLEQLAREMSGRNASRDRQASSQSPSGQQGQSSGSSSGSSQGQRGESSGRAGDGRQAMRDAAGEDGQASSGLRDQDASKASQRAERALERMRRAEEALRGSTEDDLRQRLGDLRIEARQLADAQRRLNGEMARSDAPDAASDKGAPVASGAVAPRRAGSRPTSSAASPTAPIACASGCAIWPGRRAPATAATPSIRPVARWKQDAPPSAIARIGDGHRRIARRTRCAGDVGGRPPSASATAPSPGRPSGEQRRRRRREHRGPRRDAGDARRPCCRGRSTAWPIASTRAAAAIATRPRLLRMIWRARATCASVSTRSTARSTHCARAGIDAAGRRGWASRGSREGEAGGGDGEIAQLQQQLAEQMRRARAGRCAGAQHARDAGAARLPPGAVTWPSVSAWRAPRPSSRTTPAGNR